MTLIFCCTCLLFDLVEIILFVTGRLKPRFYLISQVIKTTLWLVIFIIAMVGVAQYVSIYHTSTILPLTISIVIFSIILYAPVFPFNDSHILNPFTNLQPRLSFVATLIYASVIHSRARLGRADRAYISPPYQDASPPYRGDDEVPLPPQPAPAPVTINEIGHEHGDAATFEMPGRSTPSPVRELQSGNGPSSVILNGRKN